MARQYLGLIVTEKGGQTVVGHPFLQPAVAKSPELLAAASDHVEPVCAANLLVLNVESLSLSDSKIEHS